MIVFLCSYFKFEGSFEIKEVIGTALAGSGRERCDIAQDKCTGGSIYEPCNIDLSVRTGLVSVR